MGLFSKKMTVATHDGRFHADDIFACATLSLLNDGNIKIVRTRDQKIIEAADFVVDVGGEHDALKQRFDHHQKGGAGERENAMPYSAFGLVWKTYGEKLCGSKEIADRIDMKFVQSFDAWDNGIDMFSPIPNTPLPYLIQYAFYAYWPTWQEDSSAFDERFERLVDFAVDLLKREIIVTRDYLLGEKKIAACYQASPDKRILILDGRYPWEEVSLVYPEPLFVVGPRADSKWKAEGILKKTGSFERRAYFPESWAGKRDEELVKVTGVADAVFCHNGRFLAVAETREGALALAQKALSA